MISESERLMSLSRQEDNDIKSFALMCKALREQRCERFDKWLPIIQSQYDVVLRPNSSYQITTQKFGIIDYFPKANKVLIRKDNDWKKPGLKWLIDNLTI